MIESRPGNAPDGPPGRPHGIPRWHKKTPGRKALTEEEYVPLPPLDEFFDEGEPDGDAE